MKNKTNLITSLFLTFLFINGCSSPSSDLFYDYGTKSDSARYYFQKGWEEILDNGRWTESEAAYRKALALDPDWLLAKSLLGRITRDPEEKVGLLKYLQLHANEAAPDERLLLEVNMLSIGASVNRDRGVPNSAEFNQSRRVLAEKNFGDFARKHPKDDYFKAEYIEFLHANHGAQVALDSIAILANARQKNLGFYISYAAALQLELGNLKEAISLSKTLNEKLSDPSYLSPLVLKTQILMEQDSMAKAYELINQVVAADSNHIIASGMQARIKRALEN